METAIYVAGMILTTAAAYCAVPIILKFTLLKNKRPSDATITTFLFIYCAVVWLLFRIVEIELTGEASTGAAAILYFFINKGIYGIGMKKTIQDEAKTEMPKNRRNITKYIPYAACVVLAAVCLLLAMGNAEYREEVAEYESKVSKLSVQVERLKTQRLLDQVDNGLLEQKAEFMDEHVVFVLDGYGNYYYSYDEMMDIVGDREFTFWAYNVEQAISLGYREG